MFQRFTGWLSLHPHGKENLRLLGMVSLYLVFMIALLPGSGYQWDIPCWFGWSQITVEHGLGNAYHYWTNYPPLIQYLLYAFGLTQDSLAAIETNIRYFKVIPLLFDLLPLGLLVLGRRYTDLRNGYHWLLLLNIGYLYNTLIWGQVDSIHSNLALTALFLALRHPVAATVCLVLAINMKIQAIIFVPVFLMVILVRMRTLRTALMCVLAACVVQGLVLLPFALSGTLDKLWAVVIGSVDFYPKASMNAFNIWFWLVPGDPMAVEDSQVFAAGLTYKQTGTLLFLLMSAITLFPLACKVLYGLLARKLSPQLETLMYLSAGMVTLAFFLFNSQMHERYSHPVMIFLFFYSIRVRHFGLFALACVACFLNMEKVLGHYPMAKYTLLFDPRFIAVLFMTAFVTGVIRIWRSGFRQDLTGLALLLRQIRRT